MKVKILLVTTTNLSHVNSRSNGLQWRLLLSKQTSLHCDRFFDLLRMHARHVMCQPKQQFKYHREVAVCSAGEAKQFRFWIFCLHFFFHPPVSWSKNAVDDESVNRNADFAQIKLFRINEWIKKIKSCADFDPIISISFSFLSFFLLQNFIYHWIWRCH